MKRILRRLILTLVIAVSLLISSTAYSQTVKIGYTDATAVNRWTEMEQASGKLATYDAGYLNQIREGNITDHTYVRIQGQNKTVGTALEEISDLGTVGFGNWTGTPAGVILVSDSAADAAAGTGARTVKIGGLDSSFAQQWVTETIAGTVPTTVTTETFKRINSLEVITAGTGLTNAGTITASISGVDIIALIPGHTKSMSGRDTVPAGMTYYLENAEASVIGTKSCIFHIYTRDTQVADSPFVLRKLWQSQDGGYLPNGKMIAITEKTDIIILGEGGAASSIAAASVEGWVED